MNKLLVATALAAAFSLPALAAGGTKTQSRYVGPTPQQQLTPKHQVNSYKANRKSDRGKVREDPYWTPCDYQSAWACGGGN